MGIHQIIFLSILLVQTKSNQIEDFSLHSPTDLHDAAFDKYIKMRRTDPNVSFEDDSPIVKAAHENAVKRLCAKPNDEFSIVVSIHFSMSCRHHTLNFEFGRVMPKIIFYWLSLRNMVIH